MPYFQGINGWNITSLTNSEQMLQQKSSRLTSDQVKEFQDFPIVILPVAMSMTFTVSRSSIILLIMVVLKKEINQWIPHYDNFNPLTPEVYTWSDT